MAGAPPLQVVLTGATSGIGKRLLTRLLAGASGAPGPNKLRVVIPTRSMERAKELFGGHAANVAPVACDLADLASVRQAAKDISQQCAGGVIDVLILNAGIMSSAVRQTAAGYEETLAANHLGHFLLLHELLPLLLKAQAPRVVLVGSELHKSVPWPASASAGAAAKGRQGAPVAWEPEQALFQLSPACRGKIQGLPATPPAPFTGRTAYNVSKLYNLWTARVLARRGGDKLWVACVSPGFVPTTGLSRGWGAWGQWAARNLLRLLPFAVSEEEGVERVWQVAFGPLPPPAAAAAAAAAPAGAASTTPDAGAAAPSGSYWARRKPDPGSELSRDLVRAQRMWDNSMQVLGLTDFLGPPGELKSP